MELEDNKHVYDDVENEEAMKVLGINNEKLNLMQTSCLTTNNKWVKRLKTPNRRKVIL